MPLYRLYFKQLLICTLQLDVILTGQKNSIVIQNILVIQIIPLLYKITLVNLSIQFFDLSIAKRSMMRITKATEIILVPHNSHCNGS